MPALGFREQYVGHGALTSESFVRNGSVEICAQAFGNPDGKPLLLIMGSMASMVWWPDDLMQKFADGGFYAVRFDHRDTGRSTATSPEDAPYDIHDMADDALAVMDGFGMSAAHIVGMSLGGLLGQLIALRNPDRVLTLTLIAAEIFGDPGSNVRPIDRAILELFETADAVDWGDEASATSFLSRLGELTAQSARPARPEATLQRAFTEFKRARNITGMFNHAKLDGRSPWQDRTHEISSPILLLHGDRDVGVDYVHSEAIAARARNARLVTLQGAGHDLHPDDWPKIVSEIKAHVEGN